jgi:hypothetical protein
MHVLHTPPHNTALHKHNTWKCGHLYSPAEVNSNHLTSSTLVTISAYTLRDQTTNELIAVPPPPPENNPHQYEHATSLNLTWIQFATQLLHQTSTLEANHPVQGTSISIQRRAHDSSHKCYGLRLFRWLFGHVTTLHQLMSVLLLAQWFDSFTMALVTGKPVQFESQYDHK